MQMSNDEIVRNYREAKDKAKQLGILAELNACDKQKIKDILTEGGIDYRSFPRSKREKKATAPAADNKLAKAKRAAVQKKPVNTQCDENKPTKKRRAGGTENFHSRNRKTGSHGKDDTGTGEHGPECSGLIGA